MQEKIQKIQEKNLKMRLKRIEELLLSVFKEYPVTLGCVLVATLLIAIFLYDTGGFLAKIEVFLILFSVGSLFAEETCVGKKRRKGILFLASAVFAAFYVFVMTEEVEFAGIEYGLLEEGMFRFYTCYISILVLYSIFHMFKRSGIAFEKYCMSAWASLLKSTLIYFLFALGVAIIILIFNVLLFDTGDFLLRLEIFLAGGIYMPAIVLSFSQVKEETGKFAKAVVLYVLFPMLFVAFGIIYLYIIKIIVAFELPSNEVFRILAFLFVGGFPIWTMASGIEQKKTGRIAEKLPFAFIPFVILQGICIGMRISAYGVTTERYMACVLLVLEVAYLILYSISTLKKKKFVPYIFYVTMILILWTVLLPGVNYSAVTQKSQYARMQKLLEQERELTILEKKQVYSSYKEILYAGYGGKDYLDKYLSETEQEEINKWGSVYDFYDMTKRYSFYHKLSSMDISEYAWFGPVSCNVEYSKNIDITALELVVGTETNPEAVMLADLSELIEKVIECEGNREELEEYKFVKLDEENSLFVTDLFLVVNEGNGNIEEISLDGYLFRR